MFKYNAVIIEPRRHKALSFVLNNFLTNLSDEWGLIIFCGNDNKDFIDDLFKNELKLFEDRLVKLIKLDINNLTITDYNNICKSQYFYKCIDTEIMLIFQTDTLILKENKDQLTSFLKYDYVGAPWPSYQVGNGGLSLRKKSKMIEICENVSPDFVFNEDNYFSCQNVVHLDRPSFEEAQKFSVETIFHEKSFGIHAPWKHLTKYQMDFLINKYPDILTLMKLNDAVWT
jgi:hypothetical protein